MTPQAAALLADSINGIITAGLTQMENPLFVLYTPDGKLAEHIPAAMSPADIIDFVREHYGDDAAQRCESFQQLTSH
jgi:hypothetical protein